MEFDKLNLDSAVLEGLNVMNFSACTPVQEKTIPIILEGRDLIACAQTGTGKTAAYLLPLLHKISRGEFSSNSINALIMAPTRELAQQIDQQVQGFGYFVSATSIAIYGGNDGLVFGQQQQALKTGVDIVIATPGRLISHIDMNYADFSKVNCFILDEADRMLDMGFFDDIMKIASVLPKKRQTVMFSATMPEKIKQLAKRILNDPAEISLSVTKPAEKIDQNAYVCYENQKMQIIEYLFKNNKPEKVVVFSSSKQKVKEIARAISRLKISVAAMHSDLTQQERDKIMLDFRNGKLNVLVGTDIISRGIDVEGINIVINFDVPHDVEDYVHRVGRTARAEANGEAITFISESDQRRFERIERFLEKEIKKKPLHETIGEGPVYNPKAAFGNNRSNFRKKRFSGKKNVNNTRKRTTQK